MAAKRSSDPGSNSTDTRPEREASGAPLRVLMVEDDNSIAYLIAFLLKREGFDVLAARDGLEATGLIETVAPVDLVLLDVMLPYHDGFQLIEQVRARAGWREVPIVMLTGASMERDIARALEAGADDYIVKPFKPQELVARLRRILRRST